MRVLLVGDADSPHTQRWASAIAGRGADVAVAGFGTTVTRGVELVPLGRGTRALRYLRSVPRLRSIVERFAPDIVNAHFVSSYGVAAALARVHKPLVLSAWGSDVLWLPRRASWHRALVVRALRLADMVTFDSDDVASIVARVAPATPRERVRFGPERRWSVADRDERPIVLSVRRPEPFYNVDTVLDAFVRATRDRPEWRLEILTYGLPCDELRQRAYDAVAERVTFVPSLSRTSLRDHLLRSAVFCSVPTSDALSAALLEGMAAGSFPVASDLPVNREWIEPGVNGFLVDGSDLDSVATALERAISHPELRESARERNRKLIADTASWDQEMDHLLDHFERLVSSASSRSG